MGYIAQLEAVQARKLDPVIIYVASIVAGFEVNTERAESIIDAILYLFHASNGSLEDVISYVKSKVGESGPVDKEELLVGYEG